MTNKSVLFYVSVDNVFSCAYLLSTNRLNERILPTDCTLFNSEENLNKRYLKTAKDVSSDIAINTPITISNNDAEKLFSQQNNGLSDNTEITDSISVNTVYLTMPILLVKHFVNLLQECSKYRKSVVYNINKRLIEYSRLINKPAKDVRLVLEVSTLDSCKLDYAWGDRLVRQIRISIERECAAAWLSTLGGAFSALGEQSDRFASMALKTSLQQIQLAGESEDTDGIARGWLFLALALSQLGYSDAAFHLLNMALGAHSYDDRHKAMCMGVEVKLKYDRKVRKQRKPKGILKSPQTLEKKLNALVL